MTSEAQPRLVHRSRFSLFRVFAFTILTIIALVTVYPFIWMVLTSLRDARSVFAGPFIPNPVIFTNYPQAWTQTQFGSHFLNSLFVSAVSLAGILFLSITAGYGFAKLNFPFKNVIYVLLLSTMAMPAASLIIPLFLQVKSIHLLNSLWGLILVYVGSMSPFSIFLMRSFFEGVPDELIEAARMDGSGEWYTLFRVVLPLVRPGIGTVIILQFLSIWNEFLYAAVLIQSTAKQTLQPTIFHLNGQYATNWTLLAASLTMAIFPIVIVYVNMQKQFVAGLTQGALKW